MKLTPEKLTAFCAALAETGNVSLACQAVAISRQTAYEWRDEIPDFAKAWDRALRIGMSGLEDEALRRAKDGIEEPVFYLGEKCGSVRKYSDTLTIFLLKAHDPKYRDKSEVTMRKDDPSQLTDEELNAEITRRLKEFRDATPEPEAD